MDDMDMIRTGLTLSPGKQGAQPALARETGAGDMDLWKIWDRWKASGYAGAVSQEELEYVQTMAGSADAVRPQRYVANRILAERSIALGDTKRAMYYLRTCVPFGGNHGVVARCYLRMMQLQENADERMPFLDKAVVECLRGIKAGERASIDVATEDLDLEEIQDPALHAAACLAWSTHEENTDPFDREQAEADHHRYKKEFQEHLAKGCPQPIYDPLPGEGKNASRWRVRLRKTFLERGEIIPFWEEEKREAAQSAVPSRQMEAAEQLISMGWEGSAEAVVPTPDEQTVQRLMASVDAFARRHTRRARTLPHARASVLKEYVNMAAPIVREIRAGNGWLMRAVMDCPEVFEDMRDHLLLSMAATGWLTHPDNTDGGEKIVAGKKSKLWMETALAMAEVCDGVQPIERRFQDLPDSAEKRLYRQEWMDLLRDLRERLSKG